MGNPADKRIGILGGTFNPIHIGHLMLAQDAIEIFDLNRVVFVPCAVPPHKPTTPLIAGAHRLSMIERAIEWNPFFEVSDLELKRPGVSYAADTVAELKRRYPQTEIFFIIGLDMLAELHRWRNIQKLLEICRFVTFARPGVEPVRAADLHLDPPWPERLLRDVVRGRCLEISSSDIRYRVAEGLSIHYLVPPEVDMYIAEHGLYQQ